MQFVENCVRDFSFLGQQKYKVHHILWGCFYSPFQAGFTHVTIPYFLILVHVFYSFRIKSVDEKQVERDLN